MVRVLHLAEPQERLAGFPEVDDLGDLVLAACALINTLIITLTVQKSGDEGHLRATLRTSR
jgi:hypothetical protein